MPHLRRAIALSCLLLLAACAQSAGAAGPTPGRQVPVSGSVRSVDPVPMSRAAVGRPNMVLVLMDDFSMDLLQTMRSARTMRRAGASYSHAFVVDSLCCVSRASLFTGQYPHQTGVLTNTSNGGRSRLGGWSAFEAGGNPERSFNVRLQEAGYTTGFVGKYLNEYEWVPGRALPPLPPGWSTFEAVFGSAYDGWQFASTRIERGRLAVAEHGAPPESATDEQKDRAYAGSFIGRRALRFIRAQERADAPYFLEISAYAPHNRTQPAPHYPGDPVFPPMFRDRPRDGRPGNCGAVPCSRLTGADLPGFGDSAADNRPVTRTGRPARAWNTLPGRFRPAHSIKDLRDRAMMAQSVDRLVRRVLRAVGDDTYVVLTSDNGFHLGQLGLGRGKGTAYDTDSHVPLLVVGPGVVPGVRAEVTTNLDLAPTFEELAGLRPPAYRSGQSLVATFPDPGLVRRSYAFLEHTQQTLTGSDPDAAFTGDELDRIPSYTAVRSRTGLLVRYDLEPSRDKVRWGYEFYSYRTRSWEKRNQFASRRHADEVALLLGKLRSFDDCRRLRGAQPVPASCRALGA